MKVHVNSVFFGISELLVKSDLWKLCAFNRGGTSRNWSVETNLALKVPQGQRLKCRDRELLRRERP
jgi:hypothetical protein